MSLCYSRTQKRKKELTEDQKEEIKEAFELFDGDRDGMLDVSQARVAIRALGFDLKKPEVMRLMKEFGKSVYPYCITLDEFEKSVMDRILSRDPVEEVRKAFQLFDTEKSGRISIRDLRRIAKEVGEDIRDEELQSMIDEFDTDGDGFGIFYLT